MPNTHTPNKPAHASRIGSFKAMLATLFIASTDGSMPTSRRAMLATLRQEDANQNPIRDIALGFAFLALSLVIAFAFWPIITSAVAAAQADGNTSDTASTVLGLIPLLLAVGLLVASVAFVFRGVKELGN